MSGNTTSLYSTTSGNGTTGSNNFTTLYPNNAQAAIVPNGTYGNANVVSLLAVGTDGGNTVGNIVAAGNISGNYFLGNGSQLTGLPATYGNANVAAFLPVYGGNINATTVFGQGIATQGYDYVQMQYSNAVALPVDQYNIGTGSWFYLDPGGAVWQSNTTGTLKEVVLGNDGSVSATGNVNIGTNYYIGNGSQLTGLPATYGNANVAAYLSSGTVNSNIITSANISGGYILGNGSQLTGLPATSYGNAQVADFLANGFGSNSISTTGNIDAGNINATNKVTGALLTTTGATGNIQGAQYISGQYFIGETVSVTGNITADYYIGNGSQLTGLPEIYGNANVADFLANGFGSNTITTTGNISTGNILVANDNVIYASQGYYGPPDATFAPVRVGLYGTNPAYAIGVESGHSWMQGQDGVKLYNGSAVSLIANASGVTVNNLFSDDAISAVGNITADYYIGNGSLLTGIVSDYGNANVADFLANGFGSNTITTTGNITADYYIGNGSLLTGLPATYSNANVAGFMAAFGSNIISSTGNVTTTANISGGYILGNGSALTGIISSYGNANVAGFMAAFGSNVISSTGNVTTTANISGSYFLGNGRQLTGINSFGTVAVAGQSNLIANTINSTLTLAAGTNITITTAVGSNTVTITSTASAGDTLSPLLLMGG